jgi:hypothetical protein
MNIGKPPGIAFRAAMRVLKEEYIRISCVLYILMQEHFTKLYKSYVQIECLQNNSFAVRRPAPAATHFTSSVLLAPC